MPRYSDSDLYKLDHLIKKEYHSKTAYTIACLGGSKYTALVVKKRAAKLGFKAFKEQVEWTHLDIAYITSNYPNYSAVHLANYFDVDLDILKRQLVRLGLVKKKCKTSNLRRILGGCADEYDTLLGSLWNA